jgi:hypothetical protein
MKCTYNGGKFTYGKKKSLKWMTNQKLQDYITKNSQEKSEVKKKEGFKMDQSQVYWAVFEEDDFEDADPHVTTFGRTQVYVGKAKEGIKQRWTGSQTTSHCKKMEFARNVMCEMTSYDPTALKSLQLVDLRLLLHRASRQSKEWGLFIMKEFAKNSTKGVEELNTAENKDIQGIILPLGKNGGNGSGNSTVELKSGHQQT